MKDKLMFIGQMTASTERLYFKYEVPRELEKEIKDHIRKHYGDDYCVFIDIDIKLEKKTNDT